MPSFDIISEFDATKLKCFDQANTEVSTRFDFKGSNSTFEPKKIS
jgi:cyclic-di-GMP-binding protein